MTSPDTYNLAAYVLKDHTPGLELLDWAVGSTPGVNFGASKLVARFAQLLLTAKGSDKTDPQAGCNLMNLLTRIHTSEQGYIRNEVNQVLEDIAAQMKHENDPDVPPEGRFLSATCDDVMIQEDRILVHFTIVSVSRQQLKFQLPFSTVKI